MVLNRVPLDWRANLQAVISHKTDINLSNLKDERDNSTNLKLETVELSVKMSWIQVPAKKIQNLNSDKKSNIY